MSSKTHVPIPKDFKISVVKTLDGTSCPKMHLSFYATTIKAKGGNEELVARFFQLSLVDFALQWYMQQENKDIQTWGNLCKSFLNQYDCNAQVKVTRSDLEIMKQGLKETFSNYVARWTKKASQMV